MTAVAAEVPLVLDSVLEKLATDLGDHDGSMRRRFINNYLELWDHRYGRVSGAVLARDADDAMDAILSLKISSSMVGAGRLGRMAEHLEGLVHGQLFDAAASLLDELRACGMSTTAQLRSYHPA
ncbi:MAG TPA: Hpt domain-containing protein [Arthrobacter sp.]|nr:Hpt domain-containing protein [Arthrobacter sp.]